MKLNRFVQRDIAAPIHSSGFVQRPGQMGSTSVDSFSQRKQRDKSRQLIGGYRDSQVIRQGHYENRDHLSTSRRNIETAPSTANEPQSTNQRYGSRIDIVKPASHPVSPSTATHATPPQHTYREPPSRYRS